MPELAEKDKCTGCTACVNICPTHCLEMVAGQDGFYYPELTNPDQCIECEQCSKVCPLLNEQLPFEVFRTEFYAAYSTNENIRQQSSSGGIFSEIAECILQEGGIVCAAVFDETWSVVHDFAKSSDDLSRMRTAKYSQSDLKDCFAKIREHLEQEQKVLFTGTPCQVVGLKSFLNKDYDELYCMDFVCHAIPSPKAWKSYVAFRADQDNNGSLPSKVNLRSKESGWSRYQYSVRFEYGPNHVYKSISGLDPYMRLFTGDYINRLSCSDCHFNGFERQSDLTVGDFWGIWDIKPELDDDKGLSLVIVSSKKGKELLDKIKQTVVLNVMKKEECYQQNPSLVRSSVAHPDRERVLNLISEGRADMVFKEKTDGPDLRKPSLFRKLFNKIR